MAVDLPPEKALNAILDEVRALRVLVERIATASSGQVDAPGTADMRWACGHRHATLGEATDCLSTQRLERLATAAGQVA